MTSPIECLPVEVLDIITSDFDLLSYQQLRLSSRRLYSLSLSTFAKRYFVELTTTLGSPSLDRLVDVSSHGYLKDTVTLLDITLLNHRDYKLLVNITKVGLFPPPKRFPEVPGVKPQFIKGESTLYNDVVCRNNVQVIVDRLARSLKGFSNLKTVRFRAHHNEPIGWRSAAMPEGDRLFRAKCFQAVCEAIAKSKIQLEEFSMAKRKGHTSLRKCAHIPLSTLLSAVPLNYCFMNLQSLKLTLVTAHNGDSHLPGWEKSLSQLINCALNLKHLTLSLDRDKYVSRKSSALVFLAFKTLCRLPTLDSFHLINCSVHEAHLGAFVTDHADTLKQLILHNVRLLDGSWLSFWNTLKVVKGLGCLRVASLDGTENTITFQRRGIERTRTALQVKPFGRPMSELLNGLIATYSGDFSLLSSLDDTDGFSHTV